MTPLWTNLTISAISAVVAFVFLIRREHRQMTPVEAAPLRPTEICQIRFDYLPDHPVKHGWKLAYGDLPPASCFSFPSEAPGGISINFDKVYALDYLVPASATAADRLKFKIKYTKTSMFFTGVVVTSRDLSQTAERWIKYYIGDKPPEQTQGYPNERTVWVKPQNLKGDWAALELSLPEIIHEALGSEGWIYNSLKTIRLRGSISVSPIVLLSSTAEEN